MSSISAGTTSATALVHTADTTGALQLATNNGTVAVTIDTSQNVGIGTASPSSKLHVAGGSGSTIRNTASAGSSWFVGSNVDSYILHNESNTPMVFTTNGTEQARITAAGLLQFNSGYGSVATAYGCRAWVNFNGTGTPAIIASGNMSSITDNGTGDYTVNFTTSMPDANYSVAATSTIQAGVTNAGVVASVRNTSGTTPNQTTSGTRIVTIGVSSPSEADVCQVTVAIFR